MDTRKLIVMDCCVKIYVKFILYSDCIMGNTIVPSTTTQSITSKTK